MTGPAARLPDALVGLAPDIRGAHRLRLDDGPQALRVVAVLLGVQVERVEHRAVDVVLALGPGVVSDPHRPRALVAGEVIERLLGQVALAGNAVHDLQRAVAVALEVSDVLDEVVRLPTEPER